MKNPLRQLCQIFSLQAAIDEGFAYKPKRPIVLTPEKRKELMEASSLETPHGKTRAVLGVLAPYALKSSYKEKAAALALLGASLTLNKFSIDMTVEFGNWISGLTNTVVELVQVVASNRPDIISGIMDQYPLVQDTLANNPLLNEMLMVYPDATKILQQPQFADLLKQSPALVDALQKNPTIEQVFMNYPGFREQVAANPELLTQLTTFKDELSDKLRELPQVNEVLGNLLYLSGGAFLDNMGNLLSTAFNSAVQNVNPWSAETAEAFKKAWYSRDMATIALKFTAAAIASYKATQYLILRWRSWSTGYYTQKWTDDKAMARLKTRFTNIDNPGQRLQEDPAAFTGASVSLLTGVVGAGMTLEAFLGMLVGMGPVMGVPGGFALIGVAYASTLLALTVGAGYKLPEIFRNKQRVEANLRRATDNIHNNAEQIGLTNNEETETELVKQRVTPVMKNSLREIGTQVKLIVVDATAGNMSIPLPYVVAAFAAVAGGTASMGTVTTLNYAFNRVNSSLSFIVNRFESIMNWIATAQRIYAMDKAIDACHYIEEIKRDAGAKALAPAIKGPEGGL